MARIHAWLQYQLINADSTRPWREFYCAVDHKSLLTAGALEGEDKSEEGNSIHDGGKKEVKEKESNVRCGDYIMRNTFILTV